MLTGIIGRKVGMTQLFSPDGTVTPGTVIKAGPCVVVQAKAAATDGYEAVYRSMLGTERSDAGGETTGATGEEGHALRAVR